MILLAQITINTCTNKKINNKNKEDYIIEHFLKYKVLIIKIIKLLLIMLKYSQLKILLEENNKVKSHLLCEKIW